MLKFKRLILKEIYRNIRLNNKKMFRYFIFLSLNYTVLIIIFISCINLNYFKVNIRIMPVAYNILPVSIFKNTGGLRLLLFFLFIIFIYYFIKTNKYFINKNIIFFKREIKLIKILKGDNRLVVKPVIYTAIFINTISLLIVIYLLKKVYSLLYDIININNKIKLLKFDYFDTTLFMFLFIITSVSVILTSYILFREKEF